MAYDTYLVRDLKTLRAAQAAAGNQAIVDAVDQMLEHAEANEDGTAVVAAVFTGAASALPPVPVPAEPEPVAETPPVEPDPAPVEDPPYVPPGDVEAPAEPVDVPESTPPAEQAPEAAQP